MSKKVRKVVIFYIILVVLALAVIFVPKIYRDLRLKVMGKAIDHAMTSNNVTIIDSYGNQVTFEEVVEKLEPEDEKKVNELLDKYVTLSTLQDVNGMMNGVNVSEAQLAEYVKENVSDQDIEYIKSLYEKYGDSFW